MLANNDLPKTAKKNTLEILKIRKIRKLLKIKLKNSLK